MAGAFKLDLTGLSDEASLIVIGLASRTAKTQLSIPYAVPSSQASAKDIYMILAPDPLRNHRKSRVHAAVPMRNET